MGLSYDIDVEKALVCIVGTGSLSMPAMIAAVEDVANDPRFCSHFTVVFDLRGGDYTPELQDGDAFAAELRRRKKDFQNRFAVVVPESLHFLAKLYCVLANVGGFDRMQCFTDMAEARSWCGV